VADLSLAFDILARDKASATFKNVGDQADTAGGKVGGFASKFGGMAKGLAIAGGAAAAAGALAFGKSSIDAYKESEVAQTALQTAFEKFPQLAGANADALRNLNEQRARSTKFDDDATAAAQATLAQFGLTEDQLLKVTPLLQDYAEKTGKDLTTAATDVGKAMLGQGRAFKSVGLDLKDTGSAAGNFDQLIGGLTSSVGGFAEVAGGTATGKSEILKNQFGELQEKVGGALVPALSGLTDILLQRVLPAIDTVGGWLAENKPVVVAFAALVGTGLVVAFLAWASSAAAAAVATIAAALPVILITLAIAALVAGVIWAYQNWDFFREAVDKVASFMKNTLWPALQQVAGWITGTLIPTIGNVMSKMGEWLGKAAEVAGGIVSWFSGVVSFITELPGKIGRAASGMWDGIKNSFKGAINWIIDAWNGLEFKIPGFDPPGPGPKFSGFTLGLPEIPRLDEGGLVTKTGLAIVDRGERFSGVDNQFPIGGGATIQLINHGVLSGEQDIVRWIARGLRNHDRARV
jgi:hypothetical protein